MLKRLKMSKMPSGVDRNCVHIQIISNKDRSLSLEGTQYDLRQAPASDGCPSPCFNLPATDYSIQLSNKYDGKQPINKGTSLGSTVPVCSLLREAQSSSSGPITCLARTWAAPLRDISRLWNIKSKLLNAFTVMNWT